MVKIIPYQNQRSNRNKQLRKAKKQKIIPYQNQRSNRNPISAALLLLSLYHIKIKDQTATNGKSKKRIFNYTISKSKIKPQRLDLIRLPD